MPRALLLYALVAAAFFAPAGGRLLDEQVGGGDSLETLWNAWWIARSLLAGANPWFCDWIYVPGGTPLVWHTLVPLSSTLLALLGGLLGQPAAYNLLVFAALPVAGGCAFALCRHVTGDAPASWVGGLVFMLSPFIVSKTLGHIDLLYAGLLPLWLLALLRALAPDAPDPRRRAGWLGACSLLLLLGTSPHLPVLAANVTLVVFALDPHRSPGRYARALLPSVLLGLPYLAMLLAYAIAWDYWPAVHRDLSYNPEPIAYLLPFTGTSLWSGALRGLRLPALAGPEPAVYLGLLVMPMGIAGAFLARRPPLARLFAALFVVFAVLSLGTHLLWRREVVELLGFELRLPFALWRHVPVLGAVGEAGRHAVVVYMALGVFVAWAVSAARRRLGAWAVAAAALAVATDYAFVPVLSALPAPLELSPGGRRVLDPRLGSAVTMYQQTHHERPLLGGYVSRPPEHALARYREDPVLAWLFAREPGPPPSADALRASLERNAVDDVCLAPDDLRGDALLRLGLVPGAGDATTRCYRRASAPPDPASG